jgi:hypothetical protein
VPTPHPHLTNCSGARRARTSRARPASRAPDRRRSTSRGRRGPRGRRWRRGSPMRRRGRARRRDDTSFGQHGDLLWLHTGKIGTRGNKFLHACASMRELALTFARSTPHCEHAAIELHHAATHWCDQPFRFRARGPTYLARPYKLIGVCHEQSSNHIAHRPGAHRNGFRSARASSRRREYDRFRL